MQLLTLQFVLVTVAMFYHTIHSTGVHPCCSRSQNTLYTSRKPLQHLLATGVPSCKEPGSAHEQTCKISREELPHPIKQRRDELRKWNFFFSLPLRWRLLISVDSCAEWGWPDTLRTIQGVMWSMLVKTAIRNRTFTLPGPKDCYPWRPWLTIFPLLIKSQSIANLITWSKVPGYHCVLVWDIFRTNSSISETNQSNSNVFWSSLWYTK